MAAPTLEKIIEHHLSQNSGQKLTPQLIAGLMILIGQNIRQAGLYKEPSVAEEQAHD